jgi:hypothetical protein
VWYGGLPRVRQPELISQVLKEAPPVWRFFLPVIPAMQASLVGFAIPNKAGIKKPGPLT